MRERGRASSVDVPLPSYGTVWLMDPTGEGGSGRLVRRVGDTWYVDLSGRMAGEVVSGAQSLRVRRQTEGAWYKQAKGFTGLLTLVPLLTLTACGCAVRQNKNDGNIPEESGIRGSGIDVGGIARGGESDIKRDLRAGHVRSRTSGSVFARGSGASPVVCESALLRHVTGAPTDSATFIQEARESSR